jgi:hypothetical protein
VGFLVILLVFVVFKPAFQINEVSRKLYQEFVSPSRELERVEVLAPSSAKLLFLLLFIYKYYSSNS